MTDLVESRTSVADRIYENYDFGSQVADASGWEHVLPGSEMSRPVFLENEDEAGGPTVAAHLVVRFENDDSVVPLEAYAVVAGRIVGNVTVPMASFAEEVAEAAPPSP